MGADAARSVASDELHGFRESWCRASDYRFDCTLQCLHALYSRAGLPMEGALDSLQRSLCATDVAAAFPPLPDCLGRSDLSEVPPLPGSCGSVHSSPMRRADVNSLALGFEDCARNTTHTNIRR